MSSSDDARYMARAIELARQGLYSTDPNPRVGCVIVKDNEIVGEGWHERAGGPHAEIVALKDAGEQAKGATAYVSLEPCCHHGRTAPCTNALIEAQVSRVVAAMLDPNPIVAGQGIKLLEQAGIACEHGVLQQQAAALNPGFIKRMQNNRPFIRCKIAMSLDGRTAMANGESQWITSPESRADVHRLRARSSAILTGIGTVLNDDPSLTARLQDFPLDESVDTNDVDTNNVDASKVIQPVRVVLDSHLRIPPSANLLYQPGKTLIFTCNNHEPVITELVQTGAEVSIVPAENGYVQLSTVMEHLFDREINEVLLEAGPTLNGAMLRAGLIDEYVIYAAPTFMGNEARGLFTLPGLHSMSQQIQLEISDVQRIGPDLKITAHAKAP